MRREPLRVQPSNVWAALSWPKEGRSSSMRSEKFLSRPRSLCCVFCREANLNVSVEFDPSVLTFELLLPRTVTCRLPWQRARFEATCSIGLTFSPSRFLLCGNEEKTFHCWLSTSLIVTQGKRVRVFGR